MCGSGWDYRGGTPAVPDRHRAFRSPARTAYQRGGPGFAPTLFSRILTGFLVLTQRPQMPGQQAVTLDIEQPGRSPDLRAEQLLLTRPRECLSALNISGGAEFRPGGLALGVINISPPALPCSR
jgi:hypothetical protein